jgi:hypothetical protein
LKLWLSNPVCDDADLVRIAGKIDISDILYFVAHGVEGLDPTGDFTVPRRQRSIYN